MSKYNACIRFRKNYIFIFMKNLIFLNFIDFFNFLLFFIILLRFFSIFYILIYINKSYIILNIYILEKFNNSSKLLLIFEFNNLTDLNIKYFEFSNYK